MFRYNFDISSKSSKNLYFEKIFWENNQKKRSC